MNRKLCLFFPTDYSRVMLPTRSSSKKITSMGLFPGAVVERSTKLRNAILRNTTQSLDECYGRVINYECEAGTSFSAVCVVWNPSFRQSVYQLGRDKEVYVLQVM